MEKLALSRKGTLGHYFEMLVSTLFSISPEIETTHKNVVVRDGKTTVGEFDLLYKQSGNWNHLELAIKFYLGTSDQTSGFNWYGPALRDTLGRKLARMTDYQLKLPKASSSIDVLRDLSINSIESEALMLGRLFYPYTNWISKSLAYPSNVSHYHDNGWWMHASDVYSFTKTNNFLFLPLMKYDWMAGTRTHLPLSKSNFKDINHPQMVAVFKQAEQKKFHEIQRGFIVPDDWGSK
jgi:hypothetical protein